MRFLFVFFITSFCFSSYGVKVYKISIKGNQIVESQFIRSHLKLKVNRHYRTYLVRQDVKQLYSLGFFEKISVHSYKSQRGLHIIYKVKEKPLITEVVFQGNDNLRTEDLEDITTVKRFDFLNYDDLNESFTAIRKKYKENGYFMVKISHKLSPVAQKRKSQAQKNVKHKQLRLTISIQENKKIFIKKINFIGNRNISSKKLKSYIETKEQSFLSFIGKSGVYNSENLNRDLQIIDFIYRDKGFLNVSLEKPEITFSPDKKGIYINVTIKEGPRFKVGELAFQPDKVVSEEDVKKRLSLKQGNYFSIRTLQKDLDIVRSLYKEKGYAFAEAAQQVYPDPSGADVLHILFKAKKGNTYKVDNVHIQGNYKTRDKVILRKLLLREGDGYQESKKILTQQSLQQLGFFEKVAVTPVQKSKGLLDLVVDLKEQERTGEANLGGGYNAYSRLSIHGSFRKNNFYGLGHSLSSQIRLSRYEEILYLSYDNPYFLDSDWIFGFDIFNIGQDILTNRQTGSLGFNSTQDLSYAQTNTGFSLTFGRHLFQFANLSLKYRLQKQSLGRYSSQLFRKLPLVQPVVGFLFGDPLTEEEISKGRVASFSDIYPFEDGQGLNSSISGIFQYDKRNDRYAPSKGYYGRLDVEYSGVGGDFDYTKINGHFNHYYPLPFEVVLKNKLKFGFVFSNDKDKSIPFTELFLLGGPYSLRGFQSHGVGPRRFSQQAFDYATKNNFENPKAFAQRPYGGSQMLYYSLELEAPLLKRAGLSGAVFFDIGEASNKISFDLKDHLRLNVGTGIRWKSPFGLINLDLGVPYKPRKEYGENPIEFQFGMGSAF